MSVIKRTAYQLSLILKTEVTLTDLVINEFNKMAVFYGFRKGSKFTGSLIAINAYFKKSKPNWRALDIKAASVLTNRAYEQVLKGSSLSYKAIIEDLIKVHRHQLKMSLEASTELYQNIDVIMTNLLKYNK